MAALALAVLPTVSQAAKAVRPAAKPPAITGLVWNDADADGVRDRGEKGVARVRVDLQRRVRKGWVRVARTTTGRTGTYRLAMRAAGTYRVRVLAPRGRVFARANRGRSDRVDSDVSATGVSPARRRRAARVDAGLTVRPPGGATPGTPASPVAPPPPGTVAGIVWRDLDGDGVREVGEPPAPPSVVQLWDAARTTQLAAVTSGPDGRYAIAAPPTGTAYRVRVPLVPGARAYAPADAALSDDVDSDLQATGDAAGFSDVRTSDGAGVVVDAGLVFTAPVHITGVVWRDNNANGLREGGETGTAAVLELWDADRSVLLDSTSISGAYELISPYGGVPVRVRVQVPLEGFRTPGPPNVGGDDAIDSDVADVGPDIGWTEPIMLGSAGEPVTHVDVGGVALASLGNRVFSDTDGDGIQDAGEPGRPGVRVEAWNATRTAMVASAVTNASGSYAVFVRVSASYQLHFSRPAFLQWSPMDAGVDDFVDSDVFASGPDEGWTAPVFVGTNTISDTRHDAGLRPLILTPLP